MLTRRIVTSSVLILACVADLTDLVHAQDQSYPPYIVDQKIKNNVLRINRYDRDIVPSNKRGVPVEVKLSVELGSIDFPKDSEGTVNANIWIKTEWVDERLKWSPDEFDDAQQAYLPAGQIWRPDITSIDHLSPDNEINLRKSAAVSYEGRVWLEYHHSLQVLCQPDNQYFPFEYQNCELRLASWTYDSKLVKLSTDNTELPVKQQPISTWTVYKTNATLENNAFKLTFVLKRQNGVLVHTLQAPAVCLGFMIPVVFMLPTESNHKLVLGGSLLVSQVVAFEMLVTSLPSSLNGTPALVKYFAGNIVLLCLSLACSAVVVSLASRARRNGRRVPSIVSRIFLDLLGRLVCVRRDDFWQPIRNEASSPNDVEVSDGDVIIAESSQMVAPAEWRQLGSVLDRLFFVVFLVISLVTMLSLLSFKFQ